MMIVVIVLLINAIFWGLFSHESHCNVASLVGIKNCPPHYIHLLMGILFFISAMYIQQKEYIDYLLSKKK